MLDVEREGGRAVGSDFSSFVLHGGGPAALVIAFGAALKYGTDAFVEWRNRRRGDDDQAAKPSPVADAATTNAMLLETLTAERNASQRKDDRIDELEREVETLRDEQFTLKREYETQIGELRSKVQEVTLQLEALQARLTAPIERGNHG